jgi:hypothetical protein
MMVATESFSAEVRTGTVVSCACHATRDTLLNVCKSEKAKEEFFSKQWRRRHNCSLLLLLLLLLLNADSEQRQRRAADNFARGRSSRLFESSFIQSLKILLTKSLSDRKRADC